MGWSPFAHGRWGFTFVGALLLGLLLLAIRWRRGQIRANAERHRELADAQKRGTHTARLQYPRIDLTQCIGCGSCVKACPEDGVLSLLNGQAVVVHGSRCVGHGLCAAACPTAAISLTLGDLTSRRDIPVLTAELEAVGVPGLFLPGELSGFALVRTAVAQGVTAVDAIARRVAARRPERACVTVGDPESTACESAEVLDLLIVGAGPGGLACSLRAKELELQFVTIDQETRIGGTVAAYPRNKMVMTQPVELPMHGRLSKQTYQKEELVELWREIATRNRLPIRSGVRLLDLIRTEDGGFEAITTDGSVRARNVCLALGRRGSPRKLGVPGEDLPKVSYSILNLESHGGKRILVVGGGDSAVEAALGLSEQPHTQVTVSYRKGAFSRLKARNDSRINKAIQAGKVNVLFNSEVVEILPDVVRLSVMGVARPAAANDEVFIFAGGDPPFALLERVGVSFDPADRPQPEEKTERASGLVSAVSITFLFAIGIAAWAIVFRRYYGLNPALRANSSLHSLLKPSGPVGLSAGLIGAALFVVNLTYLVRRSSRWGSLLPGTLRLWMSWHVFTGLMSLLVVILHAGFTTRPTVGGHAFLVLAIVVMSGSIGRYLYALVPHAANGTESSLGELRKQLAATSADWDRKGRGFGTRVREQIDLLITEDRWRPSLLSRIAVLVGGQFRMRRVLSKIQQLGRDEGIPQEEIQTVLNLARRAYRLTLLVTHYEEVTSIMSSWRYIHRWLGLLLILLTIAHVVTAARYASFDLNFVHALSGRAP